MENAVTHEHEHEADLGDVAVEGTGTPEPPRTTELCARPPVARGQAEVAVLEALMFHGPTAAGRLVAKEVLATEHPLRCQRGGGQRDGVLGEGFVLGRQLNWITCRSAELEHVADLRRLHDAVTRLHHERLTDPRTRRTQPR
jgi:hypothetical protein